MRVLEFKAKTTKHQRLAIDQAIRTGQFVQNKALRLWMDVRGTNKYDLSALCAVLAKQFHWANRLNSQAHQGHAERAWAAISRFKSNCDRGIRPLNLLAHMPAGVHGAKRFKPPGFPKFKKHARSVEYKTSGWKLSGPKRICFADKFGIGELKLVGTWDLAF